MCEYKRELCGACVCSSTRCVPGDVSLWHMTLITFLSRNFTSIRPFIRNKDIRTTSNNKTYCEAIRSTPCFTLPNRFFTPSRIPSVCMLTPSPLVLYTPVPVRPPRLTLTPPRFKFNDGILVADSGGGSNTDDGQFVAADRIIST